VGGVIGIAYLFVVETGIHAIWPDEDGFEWFSSGPETVIIPIAAGLIVGFLYKILKVPGRLKGFIAELEEGEVDTKTVPAAQLIAIVSLIGGASLGPEAPLGTAAGGAGRGSPVGPVAMRTIPVSPPSPGSAPCSVA
jgi:H+/Cl- antiporter ClcA